MFEQLVAALKACVAMASSHVEDIESGLADGTYNPADNTDLPEKQQAVQVAEKALQKGNSPWFEIIPVISTDHISEESDFRLRQLAVEYSPFIFPEDFCVAEYYDGYFVQAYKIPETGEVDDLIALGKWTRAHGYRWLRLDRDSDEVDLLTYEWCRW